jgi:hypothetical protein
VWHVPVGVIDRSTKVARSLSWECKPSRSYSLTTKDLIPLFSHSDGFGTADVCSQSLQEETHMYQEGRALHASICIAWYVHQYITRYQVTYQFLVNVFPRIKRLEITHRWQETTVILILHDYMDYGLCMIILTIDSSKPWEEFRKTYEKWIGSILF